MRNFIVLLFVVCVFGCTTTSKGPVEPPPPAKEQCADNQFVACPTGEACARSRGKLIRAQVCHDKAAAACDALACAHGCDIYHGEPKEIHCAVNASSTGHMKKCGGFANWACPEDMTCELEANAHYVDHPSGTCVRNPGAAN